MSLMHTYQLHNHAPITLEQLKGMLDALGMNPQIFNGDVTIDSYTGADSATGKIVFDTSPLGGHMRQKMAVVDCEWDAEGNIKGPIVFRSDSWGIHDETDHFTDKLGKALDELAGKTSKAMEVARTVQFSVPGTSAQNLEDILAQLGINKSEISTGKGVSTKTPLSMKKAKMKHDVSASKKTTSGYKLKGRNTKQINVTIKTIDGENLTVEVGQIEPTFTIEDTAGGCVINVPQVFMQEKEVQQDLENLRGIALAALTAETMAEQAVGGTCEPEVEVENGVIKSATVNWHRPNQQQQARIDAAAKGRVRLTTGEADELAKWTAKPDPKKIRQIMIQEAAKRVHLSVVA